jgi:hypothetical protein
MPPRSYIFTAVLLAVLFAVSLPLTLGFSIIVWYWLFAVVACILAVAGALKVAAGLRAPPWIGIALASPGFVWAANRLGDLTSSIPSQAIAIAIAFNTAAYLALLAAAAAALRLVETVSRPHVALRVGYGLLAAAALVAGMNLLARAVGLSLTGNTLYLTSVQAVGVTATFVKYGAFLGAAVLITMRRDIELWTGATISLISGYMLCKVLTPLFLVGPPGYGDGLMFWLQPVVMLVGGAAVWRMGSVLRAQGLPDQAAQSIPATAQ